MDQVERSRVQSYNTSIIRIVHMSRDRVACLRKCLELITKNSVILNHCILVLFHTGRCPVAAILELVPFIQTRKPLSAFIQGYHPFPISTLPMASASSFKEDLILGMSPEMSRHGIRRPLTLRSAGTWGFWLVPVSANLMIYRQASATTTFVL
jgi:hypothetical protein